jgi:Trk-type K+ transport system membrane component
MLGKWLLAGLMIVGRLEIIPILILFNRESWRR